MKKGKKIGFGKITISIVTLIILIQVLILVSATPSNAPDKATRELQKNCVTNVTKVFDACTKTVRTGYTYSRLIEKISNDTNKQRALKYSILLNNFNLGLKDCKDKFSIDKQNCYKIPVIIEPVCGDTPEKHYVGSDTESCINTNLYCSIDTIAFADSCGCGCKVLNYTKKCSDLYSEIQKEKENIKECKVDSDCSVNDIGLSCVFDPCYSAYNKNISQNLIKDLSSQYFNNNCARPCPTTTCKDLFSITPKCVNKKCSY